MVVAVMVTPLIVLIPKLGPLQGKVELVASKVRTPVPEFQVYVPLAVAVPVTPDVHFAYTVVFPVTIVLVVNAVV
jgi:hypothetical protein